MMASTPLSSSILASATVVALEMMKMPASLMALMTSGGGSPKWKLTICGFALVSIDRCSRLTSLAAAVGWGTAPKPFASKCACRRARIGSLSSGVISGFGQSG
jgi:hypothetical protein